MSTPYLPNSGTAPSQPQPTTPVSGARIIEMLSFALIAFYGSFMAAVALVQNADYLDNWATGALMVSMLFFGFVVVWLVIEAGSAFYAQRENKATA